MKTLALGLAMTVGAAACRPSGPAPTDTTRTTASPLPGASAPVLPFIEDDYGRALGEARARGLPLFIDAWAPWCHTCLSMKAYVFTDAALAPYAGRFVWLALDTEREANAPVVERLALRVLPTIYVLDAATEHPRLAWPGSMTASELARWLDGAASPASSASMASAAAIDARVTKLSESKSYAACVTAGASEAPSLPPGTPLADVLRAAMGCAAELPADAPERAHLSALASLGERVASDASVPILADDRSDLYDYVVDAYRALGRPDDASRLARTWAAFLEEQARRAPTPAARAVFDAHRLLAYTILEEPERAVPMLEQSQRDFPADYDPPARLGAAYFAMKRYDEATTALERALAFAYGPRKLRFWSLEADVALARGDTAGARRALRAALAFAATVPLTGGYPKLRDALKKRLDDLPEAPPPLDASAR